MFNKIKEYLEYRKNKRIAKMELMQMLSTTLPSIREFAETKANTLEMIKHTALATKGMEGSELVNSVIDSVANMFSINHEKFIEIGSYIVRLSPSDIQKIIVHSMVETLDTDKG